MLSILPPIANLPSPPDDHAAAAPPAPQGRVLRQSVLPGVAATCQARQGPEAPGAQEAQL